MAVWRGDTPVASKSSSSSLLTDHSALISSSPTLLQETHYEYDLLNRYTQIAVNNVPKIWYDYDKTSLQLTTKRFFNGWVIHYKYSDGHPKSLVTLNAEGKKIKDVSYVWSPDGKLQTRILDGILHEYHYDPLGRLTEVVKTDAAQNSN